MAPSVIRARRSSREIAFSISEIRAGSNQTRLTPHFSTRRDNAFLAGDVTHSSSPLIWWFWPWVLPLLGLCLDSLLRLGLCCGLLCRGLLLGLLFSLLCSLHGFGLGCGLLCRGFLLGLFFSLFCLGLCCGGLLYLFLGRCCCLGLFQGGDFLPSSLCPRPFSPVLLWPVLPWSS